MRPTHKVLIATAAAVLALSANAAWADCTAEMEGVAARLDSIKEERIKQLVEFDLKRAKKELAEGDADECQEAMDHAKQLLEGKY